ncbi:MAG: tetratricopeptide repeat protein [Verrucomicrobia bacterium]|nr:tetratricopeptide repeat protein [Verrucomicrobiota bacterium]
MRPPRSESPPARPLLGRPFVLGAVLVAALVAAYWVSLRGDFLWDDDLHVTANPTIIGPLGLTEIWTSARANYFPLVLTNFWVQHALWGLNPLGYHLVTLGCHALAAILLWRVLLLLSVPGAWLGAALWALHPVQVESVAWICELKNTQSAVFFLAAIWAWLRWIGLGGRERERVDGPPLADARSHRPCALALLFAGLAILSKPSTVMLPEALALLTWWRRERLTWRDLGSLAPFFALSALAAGWTIWEQRVHSGAEGAEWAQTWPERFAIAGRVFWFYLGKLVWPADLIFIYPRWSIDTASPLAFAPLAAALGLLALLWWRRGTALRPVLIAAVFFGALLFPVLGFFSVYFFRYSFVGDHFQYLASMAPLALAGAGLAWLGERLPAAAARFRLVFPAAVLGTLAVLTWRESREYLSSEALWRATLERNPGAFMAWANLGDVLMKQGRHREAILCFRRGLQLRPDDAPTHNDLGCELVVIGQASAAIPLLERALRLKPDYPEVHNNLGNALRSVGRIDEAIAHYEQALKLKPEYASALNNLGCELMERGRPAEALACFERAVRISPTDAAAHGNLGNALRNLGRIPEALARYDEALKFKPDFAEAHRSRGMALEAAGRRADALASFAEAVRFAPGSAKIRHDYGATLARAGRLPEAIAQFEEVVRLDPAAPAPYAILGNALAQAGRWDEALARFQAGVRVAPDDPELRGNLAVALATLGRLPEAVGEFQHALRLRPDFIDAHSNLAQILRSLGRNLEAADHFDEAERLRLKASRRP